MFEPDRLQSIAQAAIAAENIDPNHKNAIVAVGSTENGGSIQLVTMMKPNEHWEVAGVLGWTKDEGLAAGGKVKLSW